LRRGGLRAALIGLLVFASSYLALLASWSSALHDIAAGGVAICGPSGLVVALPGAEGQAVRVNVTCLPGGPATPQGNMSYMCPAGATALVTVSAPMGWPRASAAYSCGPTP